MRRKRLVDAVAEADGGDGDALGGHGLRRDRGCRRCRRLAVGEEDDVLLARLR